MGNEYSNSKYCVLNWESLCTYPGARLNNLHANNTKFEFRK